mgnify:FL=1
MRLGIQFEPVEKGIRVTTVQEGSAAAQAGLQVGDILRELDGEAVGNTEELVAVLRKLQPGKDYPLTISRGNDQEKLTIVPQQR